MIIGLTGFVGSGKTTAAKILQRDYNFKELSFSFPLKKAICEIFDWSIEDMLGVTNESRSFRETKDEFWSEKLGFEVTPRKMMTLLGTDIFRNNFDENLWIYSLEKQLNKKPNADYVISDCRFENEIALLKNKGAFIVNVEKEKPNSNLMESALYFKGMIKEHKISEKKAIETMNNMYNIHYSEWAWLDTKHDYKLDNYGTTVNLESNIKHMIKLFRGNKKQGEK